MNSQDELLATSAALHHHPCPRQVLGVRMGLLAGRLLRLDLPQKDKRLLTIVETDGCFSDGVAVATGGWVGRRTLRVEDLGKVAATFVDTYTGQSARIAPSPEARELAWRYAPKAHSMWEANLVGYQIMPERVLLSWRWVKLHFAVEATVGRAGPHAVCQACHEEIINQREVIRGGRALCRACAGQAYYTVALPETKKTVSQAERLGYRRMIEGSLAPTGREENGKLNR